MVKTKLGCEKWRGCENWQVGKIRTTCTVQVAKFWFFLHCSCFCLFVIYILMMPFFNRNWAGACGGRWVRLRLMAD